MSITDYIADLIDPPGDDWEPLPHQIPPPGHWFAWLLLGGRGAGKTAAAARAFHEHVMGPPCLPHIPGGHWPGIIAPTVGDGVTSCANGPSGLRAHCPEIRVINRPGGTLVVYPNGVEAKIFGAHTPEDVERLRSGGNRCFVWAEELAAWRYMQDCWNHMRYGLRVGPWPHVIISTTPKPKLLIKALIADAEKLTKDDHGNLKVVKTSASTYENPYLHGQVKKALIEDYSGTREGRQELYAEILDDAPGALWTWEIIEDSRIRAIECPDWFDKIAVGFDPAAGSDGDENGIVVCGVLNPYNYQDAMPGTEHRYHGFVLGDYSLQGGPRLWAERTIRAYDDHRANIVVPEINNGGEMVAYTLRQHRADIPLAGPRGFGVHATKGKAKRAEPIAAMYQQGLIHHVGSYGPLEDQMISWDSIEPDDSWSPDRMDAMVWAFTELMVKPREIIRGTYRDDRLRGRR